MEIVFQSPDYETLTADAVRLGFADEAGNIIVSGPTADGGNYFLNVVGTLYEPQPETPEGEEPPPPVERPGVWGRLRLNGGSENLPSFDPAITQYAYSAELGGWTSDGLTLAPEFIANVGVIA